MTRRQIETATTARLHARLDELEDLIDLHGDDADVSAAEICELERELDARFYAEHDDARVRQAMGYC